MIWKRTEYELIGYCREPIPVKKVCSACFTSNCRRSVVYITEHIDEILELIFRIRLTKGPIPEPVEIKHGRQPIDLTSYVRPKFKKIVLLTKEDIEDNKYYDEYVAELRQKYRDRRFPIQIEHNRKPLSIVLKRFPLDLEEIDD